MLKNYLDQLQEQANKADESLLDMFRKAGVPTSTYYRSIKGQTQLTYDTAIKVAKIISIYARKKRI